MLLIYRLLVVIIKNTNEVNDNPKPSKKQIVLIGWPNGVVYPIPANNQPKATEINNKMTLSL